MNRKMLSMNIGIALTGLALALVPLAPAAAARLGNARC